MNNNFSHISVLLNEVIEGLNIKPDGIYVDGTAGGAGHSSKIAEKLTTGRLIALDRDPDAVEAATEKLQSYPSAQVVHSKFSEVARVLESLGISGIDGMLLDLGVSSFQLDTQERGFSYHGDAALDMRMSKEGPTASDIVNHFSVNELAEIISKYGEEKFAYRIAKNIERERNQSPILTTSQLAEIVAKAVPAAARRDGNPSRKTFQALRIAVNGELDELEKGLEDAFDKLNPGGRLAVISFHSLEDRIVKKYFASLCIACTCPPDFPICICGGKAKGRLVTRKPVLPTNEEIELNKRSRSAKLRIIEKL